MTPPESILETQTEALLRRVAREQESRCRRARNAAEEQARAIVKRARQEARVRVRQALDEERRQLERSLADRRAALETDTRRAEQAVLRELIGRAWENLPRALASRWADEQSRAEWCRAACDFARRSLRAGSALAVEVDAGQSQAAGRLAASLLAQEGTTVDTVSVQDLGPGLRIRGGQACVDATIAGLLASRDWVEAELLSELERQVEGRATRGGRA